MSSCIQENLASIYRFVYSHVRNRETAEDLTSQIFLKAVRNLDRERSARSSTAWLFRVARTTMADYWRAHYRRAATHSLEALLVVSVKSGQILGRRVSTRREE